VAPRQPPQRRPQAGFAHGIGQRREPGERGGAGWGHLLGAPRVGGRPPLRLETDPLDAPALAGQGGDQARRLLPQPRGDRRVRCAHHQRVTLERDHHERHARRQPVECGLQCGQACGLLAQSGEGRLALQPGDRGTRGGGLHGEGVVAPAGLRASDARPAATL
jgi:LSD1 subclass zinc finger protein